jgi:CRISPR-associated protein Cas1
MPTIHRRNPAVTTTCRECGAAYHPWVGRESTHHYCSTACAFRAGRQAGRQTIGTEMARVVEKRAATKARRRPQIATATPVTPSTPHRTPLPPTATDDPTPGPPDTVSMGEPAQQPALDAWQAPNFDQERVGREWRESGEHYARVTAQALSREAQRREGRTLILAGYGLRLSVEHDALIVQDGRTHSTQEPARTTLQRAMHDVSRIICLGATGSLSTAAIRWCQEQAIHVALLTTRGERLATLTAEPLGDSALRRAQYMASTTGLDVQIARELVRRKLLAQQATIATHPELPDRARAHEALDMALAWLGMTEPTPFLSTLDGLRMLEGRAARGYFGAWVGLGVRWARADVRRVPPFWGQVRERSSPLAPTGNARHAVDPVNALLNLDYAVLATQCRQALAARGFDLACGFLHADKPGRDSLVYDLMEPLRGAVDGLVLDLLARTVFHAGNFARGADGSCTLHPQLAKAVVASCRAPQAQIDEHARWLREVLLSPVAQTRPPAPRAQPAQGDATREMTTLDVLAGGAWYTAP